MPPTNLVTVGVSAKQIPPPGDGERRLQRVDQRILRAGNHLATNREEHQPQAEQVTAAPIAS
jgi:hypothetical protein